MTIEQETELANSVSAAFEGLIAIAEASPAGRAAVISHLYHATEGLMKPMNPSRETSLAITNLQQSELWWREARRLYEHGNARELPGGR